MGRRYFGSPAGMMVEGGSCATDECCATNYGTGSKYDASYSLCTGTDAYAQAVKGRRAEAYKREWESDCKVAVHNNRGAGLTEEHAALTNTQLCWEIAKPHSAFWKDGNPDAQNWIGPKWNDWKSGKQFDDWDITHIRTAPDKGIQKLPDAPDAPDAPPSPGKAPTWRNLTYWNPRKWAGMDWVFRGGPILLTTGALGVGIYLLVKE